MATEKSIVAVIRASRPSFRNNYEKVVFAVHSSFLATGFALVATGLPAFTDNSLSSSFPSDEVGIEGWNEVEDEYAFVYVNPEKGNKKVLVKCLVMGDKLMVDALSEGASEPVHLEINVDEYVAVTGASDYNAQFRNLGKLVSKLESEILSKLDVDSAGSHLSVPSRSRASEEPINIDGFGSSHDHPTGYVLPPVNPIGGSDLLPNGGAGIYPSRGDFGDGSMLVGPQDPRWIGGGGAFSGIQGGPGGLGGPPPGARFDPYGPPGVPGFEPGHFGRFPSGPSPGLWTHPDLQPGCGVPGRRIHPDLERPGSGGFDDYI